MLSVYSTNLFYDRTGLDRLTPDFLSKISVRRAVLVPTEQY